MRALDRYAAIGDGRSVALVSDEGSIDWLCWPRIDSPSIFAAILDDERGGRFRVAPTAPFTSTRRYLESTNILITSLRTDSGQIEIVDFMPAADESQKNMWPERELIRRVRCVSGSVEVEVEIDPRPSYGRERVRPVRCDLFGVRWDTRDGALHARADVPFALDGGRAIARISLARGARLDVSLTHAVEAPAVIPSLGPRVDARLGEAAAWWRTWSARARVRGPFPDDVVRSALALKLLCFAPSGAIVAAPTTSLPEQPGGPLNWDYRYCWLRDASLTARALFGLGYNDEATAFVSWLLHATRLTQPRLHVLYDVYGRRPPTERTVDFAGHFGARPVRIGNAARNQVQLDVYGEVIDATARLARHCGYLDRDTQELLCSLGEQVLRTWSRPDHGLWEPRAPVAHHTHSRLLCWVALDRLLALERERLVYPFRDRLLYERARKEIRREIETRAWSPRIGAYVGVLDSDELDASVLLLPFYGFEPATSPRMRATWKRLVEVLGTPYGLRRYVARPGWEEGVFGMCSFWGVDYLARAGEIEHAEELFERLRATANDLGLFAEEVDAETGALLGNFPQGFSHVGLLNAAMTIEQERVSRPLSVPEVVR